MTNPGSPRPASQAGAFYTADAAKLRAEVERYIESAPLLVTERPPLGFVAPHAGYRFSGATAGHVYRQLRELAPECVVVLAPSHRASFPLASVWDGPSYATPLGEYPIDASLVARLRQAMPALKCERWADEQEHSLEVQVPFLQAACGGARLVPLLMGDQDRDNVHILVEGIASALEGLDVAQAGRIAFIASSDGYHGYSLAECKAADARFAEAIRAMDPEAFCAGERTGRPQACGCGPIAVAMALAAGLGAASASILGQATSADAMPHRDGEWVVGYVAACMY